MLQGAQSLLRPPLEPRNRDVVTDDAWLHRAVQLAESLSVHLRRPRVHSNARDILVHVKQNVAVTAQHACRWLINGALSRRPTWQ